MKKLVLCYDFDGTLCSGYMQNQQLIPNCKIDVGKFWKEVTNNSKRKKIDPTLSYLLLLENKMHNGSPYRGFLDGRINKNQYQLILRLSNMELKKIYLDIESCDSWDYSEIF